MNINIGDKFVAVKRAWFLDEGTIVDVTNVDEHNLVSFVFGENGTSNGYMDIDTFNNHFEKIEEAFEEKSLDITEECIADIMENSEFEVFTSFDKCTIVSCRLPNGFVITESSSCVNAEDYNEEVATNICLDKIADKIWELEAYRLQQYLWETELDIPCCCGACEGCLCEEEFDECLDTDLDCDNCDDTDCPYRAN